MIILYAFALYFAIGVVVAIAFVTIGATQVTHASFTAGARIVLLPGRKHSVECRFLQLIELKAWRRLRNGWRLHDWLPQGRRLLLSGWLLPALLWRRRLLRGHLAGSA